MQISAVIITFNEERNIARCLSSLKEVVEEILVVDSYSTDKTVSICKEFGVSFIQHPFEGHIEQKNYAMEQAQFDWVLSLDADEALSPEARDAVLSIKSGGGVDGYSFNRLNNYCGQWIRHSGWYPDRKLRLWDRRKGRWGGENPHDKVIMETGSTIVTIHADIQHYSYYNTREHDKQLRKFAEISAQAKFEKGEKASVLKVYLSPIFKFLWKYFVQAGFLDGRNGWIICRKSAYENYLKYKRLRELNTGAKT
jgi:glycosyltransferase involved in cell wall biosynthesis